jgi:hypothetical protein
MNLKNMAQWDNEILLRNFIGQIRRLEQVKPYRQEYKDGLKDHHAMLKEVKRRMDHKVNDVLDDEKPCPCGCVGRELQRREDELNES